MRILAIETSADETGVAILDTTIVKQLKFKVLANTVSSQMALHVQYGGIFPNLARREHQKNLPLLTKHALTEAKLIKTQNPKLDPKIEKQILEILQRETEMISFFVEELPKIKKPKIDAIAVTYGPGLEPALWVGVNFAKALAVAWNLPLVPVNHMEGHVLSVLLQKQDQKYNTPKIKFPAISLLVSGGHTELVVVKDFLKYKIIGATRDDAVGEAFDKVARMLGLPYPGGPEISKLAEQARILSRPSQGGVAGGRGGNPGIQNHHPALSGTPPQQGGEEINLPRPMLHSKDFDFSFSGLKTAVLYFLRDLDKKYHESIKPFVAKEFEDAAVEVLVTKTIRAIKNFKAQTLIVGGGVSANAHLRNEMNRRILEEKINATVFFPEKELSTDNALMIAIVGALHFAKGKSKKSLAAIKKIKAEGNLSL